MIKKYEPKFKVKEADDNEAKTLEAVKELIDMSDISTEDEQGKFIELLKGIVFADNKHGDAFLKKINDFTSTLKIEDFKESKKQKKQVKEATVNIMDVVSAQNAIMYGLGFLGEKYGIDGLNFYHKSSYAISNGISTAISEQVESIKNNVANTIKDEIEVNNQISKLKLKVLTKIFKSIKDRI